MNFDLMRNSKNAIDQMRALRISENSWTKAANATKEEKNSGRQRHTRTHARRAKEIMKQKAIIGWRKAGKANTRKSNIAPSIRPAIHMYGKKGNIIRKINAKITKLFIKKPKSFIHSELFSISFYFFCLALLLLPFLFFLCVGFAI